MDKTTFTKPETDGRETPPQTDEMRAYEEIARAQLEFAGAPGAPPVFTVAKSK